MVTLAHCLQAHFEASQYELKRQDGAKRLKVGAVPTVFDVPNPPPAATVNRKNPRAKCAACTVSCEPSVTVLHEPVVPRDHTYAQSNAGAARRQANNSEHSYVRVSGVSNFF